MQHHHFPRCTSCHGSASLHSPSNNLSTVTFTVRHRGDFRRLCTSCVLKYHPGHFCPICFAVYDVDSPAPTINHRVACISCPSILHSDCVVPAINCKSPPSQCPPCRNPRYEFFRAEREGIDEDLARQFLAAAKIAVVSVKKAAKEARAVAERRAKEAIRARRIAMEAVEQHYLDDHYNDSNGMN